MNTEEKARREKAYRLERLLLPPEEWKQCPHFEAHDVLRVSEGEGIPVGLAVEDGIWYVIESSEQGPYIAWESQKWQVWANKDRSKWETSPVSTINEGPQPPVDDEPMELIKEFYVGSTEEGMGYAKGFQDGWSWMEDSPERERLKMKKLYKFNWDTGRGGNVEGVFVEDEEDVAAAIGKFVYFGEICGKHSEVSGTLEKDDFEVITDDKTVIDIFCKYLAGGTGYNPLDYVQCEHGESAQDGCVECESEGEEE